MALRHSLLLLATLAGSLPAASITGLWDTGVDGSGAPLVAANLPATGPHAQDTHYTIGGAPGPAGGIWTYKDASWYNEGTVSTGAARWVSMISGVVAGFMTNPGLYTYRQTFDLTGFNLATVSIAGVWAADDCAQIFVNGTATGNIIGGGVTGGSCVLNAANYNTIRTFTISNALLNQTSNTIDFQVWNGGPQGGATGLLVHYIEGTGQSAVPEPSTAALLLPPGLALLGLLGLRRRLLRS